MADYALALLVGGPGMNKSVRVAPGADTVIWRERIDGRGPTDTRDVLYRKRTVALAGHTYTAFFDESMSASNAERAFFSLLSASWIRYVSEREWRLK